MNPKISKALQMLGSNVLKSNLVQRQFRSKVYIVSHIPSLLYDCEIRTLEQRDIRRVKAAEIEFTRYRTGYNL